MIAFLSSLFCGIISFTKELIKTLIIDTIVGIMLKPVLG